MKIREATKKDIPEILEMSKHFIEEYRKITKMKTKVSVETALRYKKNFFERDLDSGDGAIFIAEKDKKSVGYIFVLIFAPGMEKAKKYSPGYISDLHIEKEYRKQGIGQKLLKESEKWLKKKGKSEVGLDVSTWNNKAIGLYKKMQFKDKSIKLEKKLK